MPTFVLTSGATPISGTGGPSAALKAHDDVVHVSLADEDHEDVNTLKHVDDVCHVPEKDLKQCF
jgi:hypothetical protein